VKTAPAGSADDFYDACRGRFSGILRWNELDALWAAVRARPEGWYLYSPGENVPQAPMAAAVLAERLDEIGALLRREHQEDYCGIVYADDRSCPQLVKVFHPHRLGVVCGSSDHPPLPGWILSRRPPAELPEPIAGRPARRWLLF
jgi:hypothetical protein